MLFSKCKPIIMLFILSIMLTISCSKNNEVQTRHLTVIDSLDWEEEVPYEMKISLAMDVHKNKLFILDGERINVFNCETLDYEKSISKKGRGPGEIFLAQDISVTDNAIVVADPINGRIQFFDLSGKFKSSIKMQTPWRVYTKDNVVYAGTISQYPNYKIFRVASDSISTIYDFETIIEDEQQKQEESFFLKGTKCDYLVYCKNKGRYFYRINNNTIEEIPLDEEISALKLTGISNAVLRDGKYYITASSYESFNYNQEMETTAQKKEVLGISEYLLVFNMDLKLIEKYLFPDNVLCANNTLAVSENHIFFRDFDTEIVYKLKMED